MHPLFSVRKSQNGFTLIELLVVLLMLSVTMTAVISFFSYQAQSMRIENAHRAAQMTARGALNFIVRHLEHIGRSPRLAFTSAAPAIQEAEANRLHYLANLSEDWDDTDIADDWEDMTFEYDAGTETIVLDDGVDAYALTDDTANPRSYIPAGGLAFTYFNKDGNVVAPGGGPTARASIRRINVSVTVRGVVPDGYTEPEVTLSQDVFLRNVS
jgi:prepilin-type N-terminal cleavage/methylation domain-containing protein